MRGATRVPTFDCRSLDDDPGVDGDRAVLVREDGIEVELGDVRVRLDERRDLQEQCAQLRDVGGLLAAVALEHRVALDLLDHLARVALLDRARRGRRRPSAPRRARRRGRTSSPARTAGPSSCRRSPRCPASPCAARRRHRSWRPARAASPTRRCGRTRRATSSADVRPSATPPTSLLCVICGDTIFSTTGKPSSAGDLRGVVLRLREPRGRDGHAGVLEHLLRLDLGQDACGLRRAPVRRCWACVPRAGRRFRACVDGRAWYESGRRCGSCGGACICT